MITSRRITDDLDAMFGVLPPDITARLREVNRSDELLEVILDVGRAPTARMLDGEIVLLEREVSREDLDFVVSRIGEFDADNRAGMERTLHRISAIRNRHDKIVGLTCRVGRAVYGTIDIIHDLVTGGKSLLLLGRPGIGKTTMLREAARILAETKRVVIVDTSNEIAGDGDVPHPAIGRARRMQVREPVLQHEVMIEAVENHNPEVIVIDEIGRELEAVAARTIAERGVQLIGTAHGNSLENLLLNPTLSDLIGGIESVTLSDEEARRRGTQKTVLERRAAPTFDVLIEIQDREKLAIHPDVAASVDGMLRGRPLAHELRWRDSGGSLHTETSAPPRPSYRRGDAGYRRLTPAGSSAALAPAGAAGLARPGSNRGTRTGDGSISPGNGGQPTGEFGGRVALPSSRPAEEGQLPFSPTPPHMPSAGAIPRGPLAPIRVYAYGVARNRLRVAAKRLHVPADFIDEAGDAEVIVTLRSYYRRRLRVLTDAEDRRIPVYVLRANTLAQMETFLVDLFSLESVAVEDPSMDGAIQETEQAIQSVLNGTRSVDLSPASSYVRRLQHQMAKEASLISHSYGKEPNRRVRIFRD